MKIKELTLIFENCEFITIDGKYVGGFELDGIKTRIARIACNSVDKFDVANSIAVEIHKDADKPYMSFGEEHSSVFERIHEYSDITSIEFTLTNEYEGEGVDEQTYQYYVNWTGESEYENTAQSTFVSDSGNLYLIIADGKDVFDFFNEETIQEKNYTKWAFWYLDSEDSTQ